MNNQLLFLILDSQKYEEKKKRNKAEAVANCRDRRATLRSAVARGKCVYSFNQRSDIYIFYEYFSAPSSLSSSSSDPDEVATINDASVAGSSHVAQGEMALEKFLKQVFLRSTIRFCPSEQSWNW